MSVRGKSMWERTVMIFTLLCCLVSSIEASTSKIITCPETLPKKCKCTSWTYPSYEQDGNEQDEDPLITHDIGCNNVLSPGDPFPDLSSLKGMDIQTLRLRDNHIREIPNDAFNGLRFKSQYETIAQAEIQLDRNKISRIHDNAFQGIQANKLNLYMSNCTLTTVPTEQLRHITNLTDISLSENNIHHIPARTFEGFDKLQGLHLSNMPFGNVDSEIFTGLEESLMHVYIGHAGMTNFPSQALKNMKKLRVIDLRGNEIHRLPARVFDNFKIQESVSVVLANNNLQEINPDAFIKGNLNFSITDLNLMNNQLTNVQFLHLGCDSLMIDLHAAESRSVHLNGNPINCDCKFYDFALSGFVSLVGVCGTPAKYKGTKFHVSASHEWRTKDMPEIKGNIQGIFGELIGDDCVSYNLTDWKNDCLINQFETDMSHPLRMSISLLTLTYITAALIRNV